MHYDHLPILQKSTLESIPHVFQDLGSIVSGGWLQTEEPTGRVELESASSGWTAFHIGQASPDMTAEGAIPKWLDIHPASGYLPPHVCRPRLLPIPVVSTALI